MLAIVSQHRYNERKILGLHSEKRIKGTYMFYEDIEK